MGLVDLYRTWAQVQEQNRLRGQQEAGTNWLKNYEAAATPQERELRFSQLPNVLTDPATAEQFERRALTRDQLRLQGDQTAKAKQLDDFMVKAQDFYTPSQATATRGQMPTQTEARQDLLAFGRDQGVSPLVVDQAAKSLESFLKPKTKFENVGGTLYGLDEEGGNVSVPKGFIKEPEKSNWINRDGQLTEFDHLGNPTGRTIGNVRQVGGQGGATPYFTPVQTAQGVFSFDARTGQMVPAGDVVGSGSDPELQRRIAEAKAAGKEYGTTGAEAQINLPRNIQEAQNTIGLVDALLRHPGLGQAVGSSSILGIQKIPGTNAKAFMVRLNQLKGKQFLSAFESLKGGGHITEIEGIKATEAMARMDNASSEEEFITAAREYQAIVAQGVDRAKQKTALGTQGTNPTAPVVDKNADPLGIR